MRRHRGGLGAIYEIELLATAASAFFFGERSRFAPQGVVGGGPAALNRFSFHSEGVWHTPPLGSKMVGITLKQGDRIRLETPGGGGYGPAAERSRAARAEDIRLGYTSAREGTKSSRKNGRTAKAGTR